MTAWLQGSVGSAVGDAIEWLVGAIEWLGNLLDPVGEILALLWPPVLAAIAAIVLLRTVRWLLLLWRGRTPRVQISSFAWATSDNADREATWVTSLFREQLAALRLDALDPLPERAPGAPLVEIVEGVGQGVGRSLDIGKAAGRLFRTVWPDAAYEVWGTLRPHPDGGGRISVQLIERRRGNRTLLNVALDDASWEDGAREAAMAVAGALYPRVRPRDRGPWTLWKGTVPRQLMGNYHAARRNEEANRPEHALAGYHAALDQDPLNPNLRLKIAMLQERLELDLDAWVTYEAIVDESDRRAWRGPDRRVYMLALYRLAVLLNNGRAATQWVKNASVKKGEGTLRDEERHTRRRELMMSLRSSPLFENPKINLPTARFLPTTRFVELSSRTTSSRITTSPSGVLLTMLRSIDEADDAKEMLDVFEPSAKDDRERERKIDARLQILSLRRLEELGAWLRVRPPIRPSLWRDWWIHRPALRHWPSRPELARSVVRTSKLLVRVRIAASLERQLKRRRAPSQEEKHTKERATEEIRAAHMSLTKRWPFPPVGALRHVIHFLAPRRRLSNRREDSWQLHYNAACAAACVLRRDSVLSRSERESSPSERLRALPKATDRDKVIKHAIAQLEEYAYRAGSHRVAAQADWLAIDDPDLKGLRKTREFTLWASHHLPRALPQDLPTRKVDVKRFTVRVVHEGARVFADRWRERANDLRPSAAEIVDWWHFEEQLWAELGNAFREHLSWQERLSWLETLQEWLHTAKMEDYVDFSHEARGTAPADSMPEELFDELSQLAGCEAGENGSNGSAPGRRSVLDWVAARARYVRAAYEKGEGRADMRGSLRARVERGEALRAARIWARLAETLEIELAKPREDPTKALYPMVQRIRTELPADGHRGAGPTRRAVSVIERGTARLPSFSRTQR